MIKNNKINCCNLLIYLRRFEKYIISIPFILSLEERRADCISVSQNIYDFMLLLKNSNIYKETDFHNVIKKYFDEFEYLLSFFSCFKISIVHKQDNYEFNFIQKCKLPSDENHSISDLDGIKSDEDQNINEKDILTPLQQKSYEESFQEDIIDAGKNINKRHFKERLDDSIYQGNNRIIDLPNGSGDYKHEGLILRDNDDSDNKSHSDENELDSNKNINDLGIDMKNNIKPELPQTNKKIEVVKYEMKKNSSKNKEYNITSEIMFRQILDNLESQNNEDMENRFGNIKTENQLENCIYIVDNKVDGELKNKKINDLYIKSSYFIQNIVTNSIRKKIINCDPEKLKSVENSYTDIVVDISQMMTEQQRISSLIISIALSKSLTLYGVKIRISVFGETNNVWLLSDKFENDNMNMQLNRLRDALSCSKRFQSFPANALVKLKQTFEGKGKGNYKYVQVLISSLISPQVIDEMIDWDIIGQKIIVFGLKTNFKESFLQQLKDELDNYLNIKYRKDKKSRSSQVSQKMFDPNNINKNCLKREEKDLRFLIEDLVSSLLSDKSENDIIFKRKIITYQNKNEFKIDTIKEWINDFTIYLQNEKEKKFFAQNKEQVFQKPSDIYEKLINSSFPTMEELSELSNKKYTNKNFIEDVIKYNKDNLNSSFNNYFVKNYSSGNIFCSSGGNISIRGIKRWICSGFTNTNIFEKKGAEDTKKYIISFIFDLSKSAFTTFNSNHTISTIIVMLSAISLIENNQEVFIDIIINTNSGIKILDYNAKSEDFQKSDKLNEIINLIKYEPNESCSPGLCLYTAYRLLAERKDEEKIFLLTDNLVTEKNELELTYDLLSRLEASGIDLITIGVGSYPFGIDKIYPKCCYSQSFGKLRECFSICFNNIINEPSLDIIRPALVEPVEMSDVECQELTYYIKESPIDKILENSIKSKEFYIFNMILNDDSIFKKGETSAKVVNPEKEIYRNGVFKNLRSYTSKILVVLLYLGESNKDEKISEEIFNKPNGEGTGSVLKAKGLEYTIVYNYKDAMDELTINENGRCKYLETWIFCSDGSGDYPKGGKTIYDSDKINRRGDGRTVTKKDNEKELIPFLETVGEYNRKGGALLLFCDNEPFTFEANLLLSKYLNFEEVNRVGANFIMSGNYVRNPNIDKYIKVRNDSSSDSKRATFDSKELLFPPGKGEIKRLSLRVGMKYFNEGITLSYAKTYDNSNNYEPFSAFAYSTDDKKDKAIILYYDPKINPNNKYNRGPIVVHGGFTSAFYEFTNEGTGKLIISIACWLGRIEEGIKDKYKDEKTEFFVPTIQRSNSNQIFKDWYKIKSIYTILILDVSFSMSENYDSLIQMTNSILESQKESEENEIALIFFGGDAKLKKKGKFKELYQKNNWEIKKEDINDINTGDTIYNSAFQKAKEHLETSQEFILKRVLFFTDGLNSDDSLPDKEKLKKTCEDMKEMNYKLYFFGFGNSDLFKKLEELNPDYLAFVNNFREENNFEEMRKLIEAQFAT